MDEQYLTADVRLAEMERAASDAACELVPIDRPLAGVFTRLVEVIRSAKREVVNAASIAAM